MAISQDASATEQAVPRRSLDERGALSPVAIANLFLRERRLIGACMLACAVLVVGVRLIRARTYTATSIFMPQAKTMNASLAGMAAQFGVSLPGTDATQSPAFYADLATTREILSRVADGQYPVGTTGQGARPEPLATLLRVRADNDSLLRQRVIDKLDKMVSANVSLGTGVVTLEVKSDSPVLSAELNRKILDLLNEFNLQTRQSRAGEERKFTEAQVQVAAAELRDAENREESFMQANRAYRNSPELQLQKDRLDREVSMRQQLYTTLAQALEQARIDEVRDTPVITVVQPPNIPARPDSRGLVQTALLALAAGLVIGVLLALVRDGMATGVARRDRNWVEFAELARSSLADVRHPIRTLRGRGTRRGLV